MLLSETFRLRVNREALFAVVVSNLRDEFVSLSVRCFVANPSVQLRRDSRADGLLLPIGFSFNYTPQIMSHHRATIPQVLYNTPDPFTEPSELYKIIAEVLPSATDPIKCWLVTEEHGYWNEATKSFENRATTLKPEDPIHCVSLDEAFKAIEAQVMLRVSSGFKYQFEWDPMSPTHFRKFEIQPDGAKKEY